MDLDEIERVLVGDDVTGTEAWVALALLIVGVVRFAPATSMRIDQTPD